MNVAELVGHQTINVPPLLNPIFGVWVFSL
jgi:hypothetical protein